MSSQQLSQPVPDFDGCLQLFDLRPRFLGLIPVTGNLHPQDEGQCEKTDRSVEFDLGDHRETS